MYSKAGAMRKAGCVCAVLLLVGGCSRPVRAPETTVSAGAAQTHGAQIYQIDPQASDLRIFVYRGGALARLGHNHVIRSHTLNGRAWLHPQFERSGFELEFAVAELSVDEEAARAEAGPEFASRLSATDRDATRRNMLKPELLDAAAHPQIRLRSEALVGAPPEVQATTLITIRGVERSVLVPMRVQIAGDELLTAGEFALKQSDFGIQPFSVVLGALQVQDELRIQFQLKARRQPIS